MKSLTINEKIGLVIGSIFLTATIIFGFTYRVQVAQAIGFRYPIENESQATTTATFLRSGAGATATTTVVTDGEEQLTLLVMLGSSTTPPVLSYRVQYSYNGIDWYDEDSMTTTNIATTTYHVSSGFVHVWPYSSTTANQTIIDGTNSVKFITKKIVIPNLDTVYTRIVWINGTGGDALLNVRYSTKNTYILQK